jgi:hypothetical protein
MRLIFVDAVMAFALNTECPLGANNIHAQHYADSEAHRPSY